MGLTTKTDWTSEMEEYILENFGKVSARLMSKHLKVGIDTVRVKYRSMGLKAIEMEYWTAEQIEYLRNNYGSMGDVELSLNFEEKWPKNKPWTRKHIEKKRLYLKLNRTKDEIDRIRWGNYEKGLMHSPPRFVELEFAEDGEIRMWKQASGRLVPRIKINGNFQDWCRWRWEKEHGPVPKGMNVVFIGDPSILELSNLQVKSNYEMAKDMYSKAVDLDDKYIIGMLGRGNPELREKLKQYPELIELKKQQLKLNRAIKNGKSNK